MSGTERVRVTVAVGYELSHGRKVYRGGDTLTVPAEQADKWARDGLVGIDSPPPGRRPPLRSA